MIGIISRVQILIQFFLISMFTSSFVFAGTDAFLLKEKVVDASEVPFGYSILSESICISSDGTRIGYAATKKLKISLVINNDKYFDFSAINKGFPLFSPDSKHFIAIMKKIGWVLVVDGKQSASYDAVGQVLFSPDSKRLAYVVQQNKMQHVILNGKKGPGYEGIAKTDGLIFSPDSLKLAYPVFKEGRWLMVIDGKNQSFYDKIGTKVFSPDSKHFVYAALKNDKWVVVFDGRESPFYDAVNIIDFSPNGRQLVYTFVKDGQHYVCMVPIDAIDEKTKEVFMDKNAKGPYDWIEFLGFSPDASRFAFTALKDDSWFSVIDGKKDPKYDQIVYLNFSSDSKRVAYAAKNKDKWRWVIDGDTGREYDMVGDMIFSPDSKKTAFMAMKSKAWHMVIDGQEGKGYLQIGPPVFSPDSKYLAYMAVKDAKMIMVINEKQGKSYDAVGGISYFSPDSKHHAYMAKKDNMWLVVVDEKEGAEKFDGFLKQTRLVFNSPNSFHALALRSYSPEFVRLEVEIDKH
jgi:WD40 repeat protein